MKKWFSLFLFVLIFVFTYGVTVQAELVLSEDFDDSSGFTIGGGYAHYWIYWGVAPLSGTASVPSNFVQGGNQSGNIFYGSFAKASAAGGPEEPSPTMTINIPDLSGYTNLELTVALAAPEGIWENSHRDSLYITGDTGPIDSFLPTSSRNGYLRSQAHSSDLLLVFQEFGYAIDSSLSTLTFTFASTDYPEVIGIDSVRIDGDPVSSVPEPSTILLLGAGLAGVGLLRRRFKN